jgi:hypothetical protein
MIVGAILFAAGIPPRLTTRIAPEPNPVRHTGDTHTATSRLLTSYASVSRSASTSDVPGVTSMSHDLPHPPPDETADVLELLRNAERLLVAGPNDFSPEGSAELRSTLTRVEAATPGGAPLHAQLDTVRKWLSVLERPEEHGRFGGTDHLRGYLLTQFRLAGGALEDYLREMT